MKNSQLFAILPILSKSEIRAIKKWLDSPFHNHRTDVQQLFEYLITHQQEQNEADLDKVSIFNYLFPKEVYNDAKLRQSIHFLTKAIEAYLCFQELMDTNESNLVLSRVYRKRGVEKLFDKHIKLAQKQLENMPYRDDYFLQYCFELEREKYLSTDGNRKIVRNIQELTDTFDKRYIATKLKQMCFMQAASNVYKLEYDTGLFNKVLEYLNDKDLEIEPAIGIYYYGYLSLEDRENEAAFFKLKQLINTYKDAFSHHELKEIYLMALNYCIARINAGKDTFLVEAFNIYKQGFEAAIFIEDGKISQRTYFNTVFSALKIKEYEWAAVYIEQSGQYLEKKYRANFVNFSKARLSFELQKYDEAQELLSLDYDDILIFLTAKTLLIKILYVKEEFKQLESLLESLKVYLKRKKVVGYHRELHNNIINYTKKLIRVNPYDKSAVAALKTEIENASPLTEKKWLLEQLDKL